MAIYKELIWNSIIKFNIAENRSVTNISLILDQEHLLNSYYFPYLSVIIIMLLTNNKKLPGVPIVAQWVKDQCCYGCGIGCSSDLTPGLGTSKCYRCSCKKKKKKFPFFPIKLILKPRPPINIQGSTFKIFWDYEALYIKYDRHQLRISFKTLTVLFKSL